MPTVKVLVVTDESGGFQRSNNTNHRFHLGEFVKVLTDTTWSGFTIEVTRAHRDADPSPATPQPSHPVGADLYGFRFSAATLAGFDMALFFSIADKSEDPVTSDASRKAEAAAVAEFMEAGKGFFAAGDHEDLGASICQHIPRVRSMRRWAKTTTGPHNGPVAPSGIDADRHDTLRSGSDTGTSGGSTFPFQFNDQSDDLPQPISPKAYTLWRSKWFARTIVHPLLCSPLGRIAVLPDHMHEGWCEMPADLTRDEDLPGRTGKKEYPLDSDGTVVEPEVIADATVLGHQTLNQEFGGGSFEISPATPGPYSFGVIGAYDGHRASIGRVVVDATWHHFVNINVIGTDRTFAGMDPLKSKGFYTGPGDSATPEYERIKWYYRNIVYWLIPAARGRFFALRELADAVMKHPNWEEVKTMRYRVDLGIADVFKRFMRFGHLAEEYFATTRGPCTQFKLLEVLLYPIKPLFPWEILIPEIDPWNPRARMHADKREPQPEWRQSVLPDASLMRRTLMGTLALIVSEAIPRYGDVDEKQFAAVQKRVTELLPKHLEIAAGEIEAGARDARVWASQFREIAEGMRAR